MGGITKEINQEYTRMFNGEGHPGSADGNDRDSPRGKPNSTVYSTPAQQREMRESRKEKFLSDFNTSPKYLGIREKLKKALMRVAV